MSFGQRLRYSLTARLLLIFGAVAVAAAVVIGLTFALGTRHYFERVVQPHLERYLDLLGEELGDPPDVDRAAALIRRVPVELIIRGPVVDWSSSPATPEPDELDFREQRSDRGRLLAFGRDRDRLILRTRNGEHTLYFIIRQRDPDRHGGWVVLLTIGMIGLLLLLTYRLIRRLFRPVGDIQQGVRHFAAGELEYRIPRRRPDELGDLVERINTMATDIRRMLDAKRQLLLAISHELRTPITRARVSLALLEDSGPRRSLERDLAEMDALIGELLEAERLDTRHAVLNREPVAINRLVAEVLAEFPDQAFDLRPLPDDPYVLLDPVRIRLLLRNLLGNALRHNRPERGPPALILTLDEAALELRVRDHGEGVAPEHLAHLTEPFYRVDTARQRRTGGYGLGLYLCRMIAEAHGGRLEITSRPGEGIDVRAIFPTGGSR